MKKTRPTEDQKRQLAAIDAIKDAAIDLSDIPDQSNKSGWVRPHVPASHASSLIGGRRSDNSKPDPAYT